MSQSTLKQQKILEALHTARGYAEKQGFAGYDPYDVLTSTWKFQRYGKWIPILATQVQKRNPINIRPLIGIKKDLNPKGLGLFLHGYALLQQKFPLEDYRKQGEKLLQLLHKHKTLGFKGTCWGYNFGWASPVKYLPAYAPTSVVTGFICKGLYAWYKATGSEDAKDLLLSAVPFITYDLQRTEFKEGICISYSTAMRDCCYNASLLGAEVLAMAYSITQNEEHRKLAVDALRFVVNHQHHDGHWGYSLHYVSGHERTQTDFHQGFILESLWNIAQLVDYTDEDFTRALQRGLDFYVHHQFAKDGQSYFRLPAKMPADIHHQAQGIITLCRMRKFAPGYVSIAKNIAAYTLKELYDPIHGNFYYRKHRFYTDKTPYIRWGQAWMFLALTELVDPA